MRRDAEDAARPSLLTTKDVQDLIKVDRSTIYRLAESGRLPGIKVGRQWRFPKDRLYDWLDRREVTAAVTPLGSAAELPDLISRGSIQAIVGFLGDLLGIMVLVTDMSGRPLAEVANPCGLFAAAHRHPGVLERCISAWRELADEPDMEPQWKPTPLGFLCARTLVRVGDQLKGMVLAGGIAPAAWPPGGEELADLAAGLGIPPDLVLAHVGEVYRLAPEEQQRVLQLLPRAGALISRLAGNGGSKGRRTSEDVSGPGASAQRSDQ